MNLVVTLEFRFDRTPDGKVWTKTTFAYAFWSRYLAVFDCVRVVARARDVEFAQPDWKRVDGECVSFSALPHYIGPLEYLRHARQIRCAIRGAVNKSDAVIMRVGSQIAAILEPLLRKSGHPYGLEVVGDPWDAFAPGAMKHPLRPLFRWSFSRQLRRQCRWASATAYVTEQALQRRYPPGSHALTTSYSSIELLDTDFVTAPRSMGDVKYPLTIVSVGTMAQLYKAQDVLIAAVADCVRTGLNLKLVLIGDGKHRAELEALSEDLGISERVTFTGKLAAGERVRAELDRGDLLVLASRQEGLPRAMIEAMARALPCIGSIVGGIPELLPGEDMVMPGDRIALARKIREVVAAPSRMARMSVRNLAKASDYRDGRLAQRRTAFYRHLRAKTETWLEGNF